MMGDTAVLRYMGYYLDAATGGYPLGLGYRTYLPGLMRFTAPDSESPFELGGINSYAYCEDDPINRADPSGHFSFGIGTDMDFFGRALQYLSSARKDLPLSADAAVRDTLETDESAIGKLSLHDKRAAILDAHLSQRAKMRALPNQAPNVKQPIASPGTVFGLRRDPNFPLAKNRFSLYDLESGDAVFAPHGVYNFVIRADDPQVVRVALKYRAGHTSLTQLPEIAAQGRYEPTDVYYAGEVEFWQGRMGLWNGESGHYEPPENHKSVKRALTPWVRRILPLKKRTRFVFED